MAFAYDFSDDDDDDNAGDDDDDDDVNNLFIIDIAALFNYNVTFWHNYF